MRQSPHVAEEFILSSNYQPYQNIDFTIPAGTSVVFVDQRNTVHFRTKLNYFNVLHNEMNELLAGTRKYTDLEVIETRQQRCVAGLKYLACAVRYVQEPHGISEEMVHPTEMVFDVLLKFKNIQQPPIQLLAKCLEICTALVPLFDMEIFQRIVNLNILPLVRNKQLDFASYCNGVSFESGLVGYYLINFEKNIGQFNFLLAYLNFLKTYSKISVKNTLAIELPGLLFMLREIFPHVQNWRFECDADRQHIYVSVMQYFLDILQGPIDSAGDSADRLLLRDICVNSLLNLDNGMSLLRFVEQILINYSIHY